MESQLPWRVRKRFPKPDLNKTREFAGEVRQISDEIEVIWIKGRRQMAEPQARIICTRRREYEAANFGLAYFYPEWVI